MAQIITLENHPRMTAVFNAGARGVEDVAGDVRVLLLSEEFHSVVVLRDSKTLGKSAAMAADEGQLTAIIGPRSVYDPRLGPDSDMEDEVKDAYGPDYAALVDFARALGPAWFSIRGTNYDVKQPHIDVEAPPVPPAGGVFAGTLPHGVTVTMAPCFGGTQILELSQDLPATVRQIAYKHVRAQWGVPAGAFCVMKSDGWAQGRGSRHKAAPHKCPPCPNEMAVRNVGAAFVVARP